MIAQFLQPALNVFEGGVLGDVINEESSDGSAVVSGGDGAITLLAGGIPDLGLDGLSLCLDGFGSEFYADCGFGLEVEFITGEAGEEVGFSDSGISDEDHLEKIIVFFVYPC